LLLFLSIFSCLLPLPASAEVKNGEVFPDVVFTAPDGSVVNTGSFIDKKVVLLWFTDLCNSCTPGFEPLIKLQNEFEPSGLQLVIISVLGGNERLMEKESARHNLKYPIFLDQENSLKKIFDPHLLQGSCPLNNLYLVDRKGVVHMRRHFPGTPPYILRDEIRELLRK
jgi:peroxiredoxin